MKDSVGLFVAVSVGLAMLKISEFAFGLNDSTVQHQIWDLWISGSEATVLAQQN